SRRRRTPTSPRWRPSRRRRPPRRGDGRRRRGAAPRARPAGRGRLADRPRHRAGAQDRAGRVAARHRAHARGRLRQRALLVPQGRPRLPGPRGRAGRDRGRAQPDAGRGRGMSMLAHAAVRGAIDLLSAWIESQMAYAGQPALSIGIVHDQQLVWAAGFGHTALGGARATPDTLYRIASLTKLFTSTALLQLRDAGRLQLDDPIVKHLPWFSIGRPDADGAPITIRHLITHTAGLPREAAFPY